MEQKALENLINTYGKTIHMWQIDRGDSVPLGPPQLMMAFTGEGQVNPVLLEELEQKYKISYEEKKKEREELRKLGNSPDPAADTWQSGVSYQLKAEKVECKKK
ncbi:hypothetical protein K7432_012841 [Basidiobolus ranarum]|uniref:Uncharacterized protein n=1 Tax=Basidiobolus ranarum TaxID=34480 RepID=A0ABR2VSJ6_9FUNG